MVKQREQILEKQLRLVTDDANVQQMSFMELSAIFEANHGPGIYDRTFAHVDAEVHNDNDFEVILSRYVPKKAVAAQTLRLMRLMWLKPHQLFLS